MGKALKIPLSGSVKPIIDMEVGQVCLTRVTFSFDASVSLSGITAHPAVTNYEY